MSCAESYEAIVKAALVVSHGAADPPAGFLLMFSFAIAAQLEATMETISEVLSRLKESSRDLCLAHLRVISLTDDIPIRAHTTLASAFAGGDQKSQTETVEETAAVGVASGINLKFISFGQQLQCALEFLLQGDDECNAPSMLNRSIPNSALHSVWFIDRIGRETFNLPVEALKK
jgi:hypothetical protein